MVGACQRGRTTLWPDRALRVRALVATMTMSSTDDSLSIFEYELRSGIYKIQNLPGQTYMDINEHSREVCCRPASILGERRGLVRPSP